MAEGFLNVWKPAGMTSHAVVARVRRLTGVRRIGHAGTLDPDAVGILPLAVGGYTRLLPYALLLPKVYRARVAVGTVTHTGDAAGRVTARGPAWDLSVSQLRQAAAWLMGDVWQIPPQVSALQVGGRRHYEAVQENQVVWPKARRVVIGAIREIAWIDGGWQFDAEVGSGTYVRALVRDWAYLLGIAAHLAVLERRQVGAFGMDSAVALEDLEALGDRWPEQLLPWHQRLAVDRTAILEADLAARVRHGDMRVFEALGLGEGGRVALVEDGRLVAIAEGAPWRYRVVM